MKRPQKQFLLFVGLVLLLELTLRSFGEKPGVMDSRMFPPDTMIHEPLFRADSFGVASYLADSPLLPASHVLNAQGFLGTFDYDRQTMDSIRSHTGKKIVMLVGDSYTEGCCAEPLDSSFAHRLMVDTGFVVLNFGIAGTGLTQYRLVIERYLEEIAPDLAVILFYLGNDISWMEYPATPNVPLSYPIRNYQWLRSVGPSYLMKAEKADYFRTPEEAYRFYLKYYTLWGPEVSTIGKLIRTSVVASKLYLGTMKTYYRAVDKVDGCLWDCDVMITNRILKNISRTSEENGARVVIATIPRPNDVMDKVDLETEYSEYFSGSDMPVFHPSTKGFCTEDYDGSDNDMNHFVNSGHRKYHTFIDSLIRAELRVD